MVALDADSSIDTFLEVYLDGKFSNEKIKRWYFITSYEVLGSDSIGTFVI